ncbi:MAG: hypothetical protein DRI92_04400 [Aquificota bacterium]|nr:MAG: hypothetical protein DRI92_04400 [Aquificota bacterium]
MNTRTFLMTAACVSILAFSITAMAVKSVSKFGKEKPVTIEDFRAHPKDVEGYHEEWSVGVYNEGTYVGIDFVGSNVGIGDMNGAVRAKFEYDGKTKVVKCKATFDDDEWSFSKTGAFYLQFGKNRLEGDLKKLKATVRCKKLSIDLEFENLVPPLKPGSGVLKFGDGDGEYNIVFPSPRSRATGTVKADGKTFPIDGPGYISHSRTTMYPQDQIRRWMRFKSINENHTIVMAEMEAGKPYGRSRNGWVYIIDSTGRLISSGRTNFQYDGFIKDTKSSEGYTIPRRVRFVAVEGKNQVTGVLRMSSIKKISDPTADLGAIKRAFIRRFIKPKSYRLYCDYKINVKTEAGEKVFEGKGEYTFVYVNP